MRGDQERKVEAAAAPIGVPDEYAELLSRLIHDVKNPLAVVLSYAEEIAAAPEAERAMFCTRLAVNARRALQLLDDFALLSALRRDCLDLTLAESDWPTLVREAIDEAVAADPSSAELLAFDLGGPCTVRVDGVWLHQALCGFLRETLRALRGNERLELILGAERGVVWMQVAVPNGGRHSEGGPLDGGEVSVEVLRRLALAHQGTFDLRAQPAPMALLRLPR